MSKPSSFLSLSPAELAELKGILEQAVKDDEHFQQERLDAIREGIVHAESMQETTTRGEQVYSKFDGSRQSAEELRAAYTQIADDRKAALMGEHQLTEVHFRHADRIATFEHNLGQFIHGIEKKYGNPVNRWATGSRADKLSDQQRALMQGVGQRLGHARQPFTGSPLHHEMMEHRDTMPELIRALHELELESGRLVYESAIIKSEITANDDAFTRNQQHHGELTEEMGALRDHHIALTDAFAAHALEHVSLCKHMLTALEAAHGEQIGKK